MRTIAVAMLVAMAGTTVAIAQDRPTQEAEAEQPAATATDAAPQTEEEIARSQEVVCRTQRITGSLTRRTRVCATRAEWEDNARRTNQEISRITGGASGSPVCRPGDESGC